MPRIINPENVMPKSEYESFCEESAIIVEHEQNCGICKSNLDCKIYHDKNNSTRFDQIDLHIKGKCYFECNFMICQESCKLVGIEPQAVSQYLLRREFSIQKAKTEQERKIHELKIRDQAELQQRKNMLNKLPKDQEYLKMEKLISSDNIDKYIAMPNNVFKLSDFLNFIRSQVCYTDDKEIAETEESVKKLGEDRYVGHPQNRIESEKKYDLLSNKLRILKKKQLVRHEELDRSATSFITKWRKSIHSI